MDSRAYDATAAQLMSRNNGQFRLTLDETKPLEYRVSL